MDNKLYDMLKGPYNRRNVYGVVLSHGPFFDVPKSIEMRQQILKWGLCGKDQHPGTLAQEFGFHDPFDTADIVIKSKTVGNTDKVWKVSVTC